MSVISNRHSVTPFVSGKSQALTGQRLAVCSFKQTKTMTKKGVKALPSICVSLPEFEFKPEYVDGLRSHIVDLCQNAQDKIILAKYVKNQNIGSVGDDELNFDAILAYLNQTSAGKMTKEGLQEWYDTFMQPIIEAHTLEKLVTIGQLNADAEPGEKHIAIVSATVTQYRETFSALSSGVTKYEDKTFVFLLKMLDLIEEDDDGVSAKLVATINKRMAPVVKDVPENALSLED